MKTTYLPHPTPDDDLLRELAEALHAMIGESLFTGYNGQPPAWQRIVMPTEDALNRARVALAKYDQRRAGK